MLSLGQALRSFHNGVAGDPYAYGVLGLAAPRKALIAMVGHSSEGWSVLRIDGETQSAWEGHFATPEEALASLSDWG
jgi:hypothetical protein